MKQIYLLLLLLSVELVYSQSADAGGDKAVCKGNSVTIGNIEDDPKYCYSWKASPADAEVEKAKTAKITVSPSETTTYTLTVIGQDFESVDFDEVKVIVINEIKLNTVNFAGSKKILQDNGNGEYDTPFWNEEGKSIPVCYTAGNTMELTSLIDIDQDISTVANVKIRGLGTDGYDIEPTPVFGSGTQILFLGSPVNKEFPNEVGYFESFEMKWQVSFDNEETWCDVGTSKNQLYITLSDPLNNGLFTNNFFHTVVHIGCVNAKGKNDNQSVFDDVWEVFHSRTAKRVDGQPLTYYNKYNTGNLTTEQLLKDVNGDGQCYSFAKLFLDILKAQGIDFEDNYVFVTSRNDGGFLVNNWQFPSTGSSDNDQYPYLNEAFAYPPYNNTYDGYEFESEDVKDAMGVGGQNTNNPASIFGNHVFIQYNKRFYDPSYGVSASSIDQMENNGVAGFFRFIKTEIEGGFMYKYYIIKNTSASDWIRDVNQDTY